MLRELHTRYPVYGFGRHKGYATRGHMRALADHGPCPEHRRSFVNVGSLIRDAAGLAARDGDLAESPMVDLIRGEAPVAGGSEGGP
jgi:ribonuclease HII